MPRRRCQDLTGVSSAIASVDRILTINLGILRIIRVKFCEQVNPVGPIKWQRFMLSLVFIFYGLRYSPLWTRFVQSKGVPTRDRYYGSHLTLPLFALMLNVERKNGK